MNKRLEKVSAFTLIELLVAIVLMILLLGTVTVIFSQTMSTVDRSHARESVYINARYAMERLTDDLMGCLSFDLGNQNFILDNGKIDQATGSITYGDGSYVSGVTDNEGIHYKKAADKIVFRATATAGDTKQTIGITYELELEPDSAIRFTGTTKRPLFVLKRKLKGQNSTDPSKFDQPVKDNAGNIIADEELTHYVIMFNIEYLASSLTFSQLNPSPCPGTGANVDPLGDGDLKADGTLDPAKKNDSTNPVTIKSLRVTLVIVNGVSEQSERVITRVIRIPVG